MTAYTANGAIAHATTGNVFTDLFFTIGSARHSPIAVVELFMKALELDHKIALRILFWSRDCRGGAGERSTFKTIVSALIDRGDAGIDIVARMIELGLFEKYGRWDDLLAVYEAKTERPSVLSLQRQTAAYILYSIRSGNSLAAKWMPRKGVIAAKLRALMGLDPKSYRKMLVNATNVVETPMCANEWNTIELDKLTSKNVTNYGNAFQRHIPDQWSDYKYAIESGEKKAKVDTLFPYDIMRSALNGDSEMADLQWAEQPDYIAGAAGVLPIIDVSGSMHCPISGSVTAMDIAIGLGWYVSQRQNGPFKDMAITFSTKPTLFKMNTFSNKLKDVYIHTVGQNWSMTTDFQAVFKLILLNAKTFSVAPENMPTALLVISDMEFNSAGDVSNLDAAKNQYDQAGYQFPKIIFWNVNTRGTAFPAKFYDNVVLLSGYSPAIMQQVFDIMSGKFTADVLMMNTIGSDRYTVPGLTD